jgi:hypothetical protein
MFNITGKPEPSIKWYREGKELTDKADFEISYQDGAPLTISSAELVAWPPMFLAVHLNWPWSSGKASGILKETRPSWYEISKSALSVNSLPSRYHLILGSGLPVILNSLGVS